MLNVNFLRAKELTVCTSCNLSIEENEPICSIKITNEDCRIFDEEIATLIHINLCEYCTNDMSKSVSNSINNI